MDEECHFGKQILLGPYISALKCTFNISYGIISYIINDIKDGVTCVRMFVHCWSRETAGCPRLVASWTRSNCSFCVELSIIA